MKPWRRMRNNQPQHVAVVDTFVRQMMTSHRTGIFTAEETARVLLCHILNDNDAGRQLMDELIEEIRS